MKAVGKKLSLPNETALDRIVPLVSLGLVAYFAGKSVADKRRAALELARIGAATPVALEPLAPAAVTNGKRSLRSRTKSMSRTRQVLFLMLLIGIVVMVAGGGTFATFSAETSNPGSSVASGTLTMSDQVNTTTACLSKDAATLDNYNEGGTPTQGSPCQAALVLSNDAPGVTDTSGSTNQTGGHGGYAILNIGNTGSIDASRFSLYSPYVNARLTTGITSGSVITPGQPSASFAVSNLEGPVAPGDTITLTSGGATQTFCESPTVGAAAGTNTLTIGSGYPLGSTGPCPAQVPSGSTTLNGAITNATSPITVTANASFPASGDYVIQVDNEQMLVTSGQGTNSWTVTRGYNGTTAASHSDKAAVTEVGPLLASSITNTATTLTVTSATGWPTSGSFIIQVDSEQMLVTGGQGTTTWTVVRGFNSTTAASHTGSPTSGAIVFRPAVVIAGANFPANGGTQGTSVKDTSSDTIGAPTTTLASTVTNATNPIQVAPGFSSNFPTPPFTIQVDSEQMRVTAESGTGNVNWTVTRGFNGTTAASHNAGATITGVPNTDCSDAQTNSSYQVNGSSYGTQLSFNSPTLDPLCATTLLWVQEATTISGTTYYYCWFGNGSKWGDQTNATYMIGGATDDAREDIYGQCRTPTTMSLNGITETAPNAGTTTFSNVDVGTLNGNIRNGDTITFTEAGNTMTCTAGASYWIGLNTHILANNLTFNSCGTSSPTSQYQFDSNATIKDTSAFNDLNSSNPSSTLLNFDTAHNAGSGSLPLLPLQSNLLSNGGAVRNFGATVQLGKSGTVGGNGVAPATRTFYVGAYIPAGSGSAQNAIQGLVSTFGLTWHIDQ